MEPLILVDADGHSRLRSYLLLALAENNIFYLSIHDVALCN